MIPKDYMQAELYMHNKEPLHFQNLKARIQQHRTEVKKMDAQVKIEPAPNTNASF